ncbi:hypothetical protein RchiOBHm_Chr2g0120421 [Rosa chinensis]|uniref:Uncharacterized protein n=1 Tax=Rosa chinensis TaxID=74649 RepID=A0A2P6RFX1_ROSCH|nr:hypothetical protein RchiOBHm_Chr3g0490201 [Rosa chinensis]PRQ49304.1 hypothetical protein RchiOBHm_Chr2g0120421 [Rosa chinensis]
MYAKQRSHLLSVILKIYEILWLPERVNIFLVSEQVKFSYPEVKGYNLHYGFILSLLINYNEIGMR